MTQAVATLQVRHSNLALHAKMTAVQQAGFLAVPNQLVLPSLQTPAAAFWGGLFFTFSVGAALTLGTAIVARLLAPTGSAGRVQRYLPALLWVLLLIWSNLSGFDFYVNLYVAIVPPVVFFISRRQIKADHKRYHTLLHVLPVILLALLWCTQLDRQLFVDIRDRLLLSNPIGRSINQFYYHYTLYAAEVFKSPSQKTIKTSVIDINPKVSQQQTLARILAGFDWLPVASGAPVDLTIRRHRQMLELIAAGRVVLTTTIDEISRTPETVLQRFAAHTDRYRNFRRMAFYGLLYGFPIILYLGLHALLRNLWGLVPNIRRPAGLATACCLLLGVGVLLFFTHQGTDVKAYKDTADALASDAWQTQVTALKKCQEKSIDVLSSANYSKLKNSEHIPVRYWLVNALAVSKHLKADDELADFLTDPSLIVRCRACAVLGQRGKSSHMEKLLALLKGSEEWYLQMYAYNALKALGWKQTVLK
jgi:hypothetical protein